MHILKSFTTVNPIISLPFNYISEETAEVEHLGAGNSQVARLYSKLVFLLYSKDLSPESIHIYGFLTVW